MRSATLCLPLIPLFSPLASPQVRMIDYAKTKKKSSSTSAIYDTFAVDLVALKQKVTPIAHLIDVPDSCRVDKSLGLPGLLVINWMLPDYAPSNPAAVWSEKKEDGEGYSLVFYGALSDATKKELGAFVNIICAVFRWCAFPHSLIVCCFERMHHQTKYGFAFRDLNLRLFARLTHALSGSSNLCRNTAEMRAAGTNLQKIADVQGVPDKSSSSGGGGLLRGWFGGGGSKKADEVENLGAADPNVNPSGYGCTATCFRVRLHRPFHLSLFPLLSSLCPLIFFFFSPNCRVG